MTAVASIDVDWRSLGHAAWVSALAGLAILLIAGLAVACSLKATQARADGAAVAGAYRALALVCVVALAAIVVYGIYLLLK